MLWQLIVLLEKPNVTLQKHYDYFDVSVKCSPSAPNCRMRVIAESYIPMVQTSSGFEF